MGTDRRLRLRAGWTSAAVGISVFAGKFGAWWLTGSSAIFADAMESVVNVAAAALLLISLYVAARPADEDHPYGHGKVEYFSAGMEGGLIAVAAILIALEAGRALIDGAAPRQLDVGLVVLAAMSVLNGGLGWFLLRTGRETSSPALIADGRHVLADVWTSAGVIAGMAAVWATGWVILDPLIALGVAAHVLREGWKLARDATAGLMNEADEDLLDSLTDVLETSREPSWIDIHQLRAWRAGADVHADMHVVVPRFFDAERLHGIHESVEEALVSRLRGGDAVVHFDPCRPHHCKGCALDSCPVRAEPFQSQAPLQRRWVTRDDTAAGS